MNNRHVRSEWHALVQQCPVIKPATPQMLKLIASTVLIVTLSAATCLSQGVDHAARVLNLSQEIAKYEGYIEGRERRKAQIDDEVSKGRLKKAAADVEQSGIANSIVGYRNIIMQLNRQRDAAIMQRDAERAKGLGEPTGLFVTPKKKK